MSRLQGLGSPSPFQRVLRSGLGVLALLVLMADDGISPDEFACEVAVVHLTDCCPSLPANMFSCVRGGCESQLTPDLTEDRASCIKSKSCDELGQLGACDVTTWEAAPGCTAPCEVKVPKCQ